MGYPFHPYYTQLVNTEIDTNSEGSLLNNELHKEGGNPVENWLLGRLEVTQQDLWEKFAHNQGTHTYAKYQYFTPENIENAYDLILNRPDLLDEPDVRRRFLAVFRPQLLERLLRKNPDYFINKASVIKQTIEKAIRNNYPGRAAILLWIGSQIHQAAEMAKRTDPDNDLYVNHFKDPKIDKNKVDKIINTFPSLTTQVIVKEMKMDGKTIPIEQMGRELIFEWLIKPGLSGDQQADFSAYLLSSLATDPNKDLDKSDFLKKPENIARLLVIMNRLRLAYRTSTFPLVGNIGIRWVDEVLGPWIRGKKTEDFHKILNLWVRQQEDVKIDFNIAWEKLESGLYKKGDGTLVNVESLEVLKVKGQDVKPLQTELPDTLTRTADYRRLFGDKNFMSLMSRGKGEGDFIYHFEDDKNQHYRILYNAKDPKAIIEKDFGSELTKTPGWYRFTHPQMPTETGIFSWLLTLLKKGGLVEGDSETTTYNPKGIEQRIFDDGIWVNTDNPEVGVALLKRDITKVARSDALSLTFNPRGTLQEITTLEGATVVHDPEGGLTDVLNPTAVGQILFLRTGWFSNAVTEIRLLDQGIVLVRGSSSAPWTVKDGEFKGCQWVMEGAGTSIEKPLKQYGINIEQFGLALKNPETGQTHFVMWPQSVKSSETHKKTSSEKLDFDKRGPFNSVKITFDKEGRPVANSEGYFLWAYLLTELHDYQGALHFITLAGKSRLGKTHDIETIKKIETFFRALPADSTRLHLIKLKAALQINRIISQQTTTPSQLTKSEERQEFQEKARYIGDLYTSYEKRIAKHPYSKLTADSSQKELSLTQQEEIELKHINEESMKFLYETPSSIEELTPSDKILWTHTPSLRDIKDFASNPLATMVSPITDRKILMDKITHPTPEFILGQFFHLWNMILKDELTLDDLKPLFRPLEGIGHLDANLARQILLTLVKNKGAINGLVPFDSEKLMKIRQSLPTGFFGFTWQKFWKSRYEERNTLLSESFGKIYNNLSTLFKESRKLSEGFIVGSSPEGEQETLKQLKSQEISKTKDPNVRYEALEKKLKDDPFVFGHQVSPLINLLLEKRKKNTQEIKDLSDKIVKAGKTIEENKIKLEELQKEIDSKDKSIGKRVDDINENLPNLNNKTEEYTKLTKERSDLLTEQMNVRNKRDSLGQKYKDTEGTIKDIEYRIKSDRENIQFMGRSLISLDEAVEKFEQQTDLHFIEQKREAELTKRVGDLEKKLAISKPLEWLAKDPILQTQPIFGDKEKEFKTAFNSCLASCEGIWGEEDLETHQEALKKYLQEDNKDPKRTAFEKAENTKLQLGIDQAAENLKKVQESLQQNVDPAKLGQIKDVINTERDRLQTLSSEKKNAIIKGLSEYKNKENWPESLRWAIANEEVAGQAAIFDAALNAYQKMTLNPKNDPALTQLEKDITLYLIYHVSYQQLATRAQDLLKELDILSKKK